MDKPVLLGRMDGYPIDDKPIHDMFRPHERAECSVVASTSVPSYGGGNMEVTRYASDSDEDRGGCILRITHKKGAGFFPYARNIEDGIELHVAGDCEGKAFLEALRAVLAMG